MNNTAKACGCSIDRILFQDEQYIFITDAQKQSDTPAGKSYVAYSIRLSVNGRAVVVVPMSHANPH